MNDNTKKIISLLFYTGDSFSYEKISKSLDITKKEVEESLSGADEYLEKIGLSLNDLDGNISITTSSEVKDLITSIRQQELQGALSPAALETLSLILYRSPIKKTDIDYIRGVNSQFILRNLHTRGLVTREKDKNDIRTHIYKPTLALYEFLGIDNKSDLPDFEKIKEELQAKEEILQEEDAKEE